MNINLDDVKDASSCVNSVFLHLVYFEPESKRSSLFDSKHIKNEEKGKKQKQSEKPIFGSWEKKGSCFFMTCIARGKFDRKRSHYFQMTAYKTMVSSFFNWLALILSKGKKNCEGIYVYVFK